MKYRDNTPPSPLDYRPINSIIITLDSLAELISSVYDVDYGDARNDIRSDVVYCDNEYGDFINGIYSVTIERRDDVIDRAIREYGRYLSKIIFQSILGDLDRRGLLPNGILGDEILIECDE